MRVLEILLSPSDRDKSFSKEKQKQIDFLKDRMDSYVDKILDPKTSLQGKEFLKSRLRDDYYELKNLLPHIHKVAEEASVQYEVFDRKTKKRVSGPYSSVSRARSARDKKDIEYGAVRYAVRPVQTLKELFEPGQDWEWNFRGSEEKLASFDIGGLSYRFNAYQTTKGSWDIEFFILNDEFRRKGKAHGITGTGNSAKVFSTVVDILRDFLKDTPDVKKLSITALEKNRASLYLRMIKRLLPDFTVQFDGDETIEAYKKGVIHESINKVPLTDKDFAGVKEMFDRPIPAAVARIYINEYIDDDEFNDQLVELENSKPNLDVRFLIVEWIKRVMPDQLSKFQDQEPDLTQKLGLFSPVHGYDPQSYKGTNDPITGNAFGRFN